MDSRDFGRQKQRRGLTRLASATRAAGVSRRWFLGGATAVGGALLAACGGIGGGSTAPQGPVKGKVLFWQESTSDLAKQLWGSMQSTFKDVQPNVELEFGATHVPAGNSTA